jgi:hypothetical protein
MRKNICEEIRRELDELMLDETCSTAAVEHLHGCGACREFQEKQTKLRQIVGSLGTVSAPADFDFRLRARLANESSSTSHFNFVPSFTLAPVLLRGLAAAALLFVFATGAYLVRNALNQSPASDQMAKEASAPAVRETPKPEEMVTPNKQEVPRKEDVAVIPNERPQKNRTERPRQVAIRNTRHLATLDSASTRAEVINGAKPLASTYAFPIDASSVQYFKLSVDDGRGNAKTISVPTISFGSQRLMQNANQFAPKRVW